MTRPRAEVSPPVSHSLQAPPHLWIGVPPLLRSSYPRLLACHRPPSHLICYPTSSKPSTAFLSSRLKQPGHASPWPPACVPFEDLGGAYRRP